jgi:uncharacterized protein
VPDRANQNSASRLVTNWVPSLRHIDPARWRTVAAGKPFYVGWEWLGAFTASRGAPSPVALVEDGAGLLAGALPCFVARTGTENPRYNLFDLFGRDAGGSGSGRASWSPQLLGGANAGYASAVLVRPGLAPKQAEELVAALLQKFAELATDTGCRSAGLLYLERRDADLIRVVLGDECVPLLTAASAWLPVTWPDFSSYVAGLRSSRRSVIRRGTQAFERSGCRIERGRLAPQVRILAPLLANVQRRHGHHATVEGAAYYLAQCCSNGLNDLSVVFLARNGDDPVAFSLAYETNGALEMRVVGLDYDRTGEHAEYFAVLFDEPIRYAAERGLSRIEYGVEAFRAKLLRGCRLRPLWSVVTVCPEGSAWRESASERNERQYERWQQIYGPLAGGLAASDWTLST